MDLDRLRGLLAGFLPLEILAVGDFFLDRYLFIDPALAEVSIETGLTAHQVVSRRLAPGAAGTVTSNLRTLGAGAVRALGLIGDDGEGYELKRGLERTGVDTSLLVTVDSRFTPTYTKAMMMHQAGPPQEMERQDIKNRLPVEARLEEAIIERLRAAAKDADIVVVSDQVQERNFGLITDLVRQEIVQLSESVPVIVDSRERIGEFGPFAVIKPNKSEAARAAGLEGSGPDRETAEEAGKLLAATRKAPLFVTAGAGGILVFDKGRSTRVPAVPVDEEIDIVGAGDSSLAAIACALAAGASPVEAAAVGNLAAGVTVRKIGETGTASPEEVIALAEKLQGSR